VADNQRIEDLRRRVQKDPASIAFAQLAEECRRAGRYEEAVDVCRAGLAIHPGYLSARVTLGRALIELHQTDEALQELGTVLKSAPENLAAIRGTAEIHHGRGELGEALTHYRAALALARNDPDLQQTVDELARQVEPPKPAASEDGMSFEDISSEFLKIAPPPAAPVEDASAADGTPAPAASEAEAGPEIAAGSAVEELPSPSIALESSDEATHAVEAAHTVETADAVDSGALVTAAAPEPVVDAASPVDASADQTLAIGDLAADAAAVTESPVVNAAERSPFADDATGTAAPADDAAQETAVRTIAALEQWLDAIHVARAQRSA